MIIFFWIYNKGGQLASTYYNAREETRNQPSPTIKETARKQSTLSKRCARALELLTWTLKVQHIHLGPSYPENFQSDVGLPLPMHHLCTIRSDE